MKKIVIHFGEGEFAFIPICILHAIGFFASEKLIMERFALGLMATTRLSFSMIFDGIMGLMTFGYFTTIFGSSLALG